MILVDSSMLPRAFGAGGVTGGVNWLSKPEDVQPSPIVSIGKVVVDYAKEPANRSDFLWNQALYEISGLFLKTLYPHLSIFGSFPLRDQKAVGEGLYASVFPVGAKVIKLDKIFDCLTSIHACFTEAMKLAPVRPHVGVNEFLGLVYILDHKRCGLVFKQVQGVTLRDGCMLRQYSLPKKVGIAIDVVQALQHLSEQQLTHGDLHYTNVMVAEPHDQAVLIDLTLPDAKQLLAFELRCRSKFGEILSDLDHIYFRDLIGEIDKNRGVSMAQFGWKAILQALQTKQSSQQSACAEVLVS